MISLKSQTIALDSEIAPFLHRITKKHGKALDDIVFNVSGCLARSGVSASRYLEAYASDGIFDATCMLRDNESITENTCPEFRAFVSYLYARRSTGLGTPTAATGEGELMLIACSPLVKISKKKDEGDLIIDGKKVELKGDGVRVFSSMPGTTYYKKNMEIGQRYGFIANPVNAGRTAFEPWKSGKNNKVANYWLEQFSVKGNEIASKFLEELMNATCSVFSKEAIENCFDTGVFSAPQLRREILKSFFKNTPKNWDALTSIQDGIVRSVGPDSTSFDSLVDANIIVPGANKKDTEGNYFRLFNRNDLGWYYRFV